MAPRGFGSSRREPLIRSTGRRTGGQLRGVNAEPRRPASGLYRVLEPGKLGPTSAPPLAVAIPYCDQQRDLLSSRKPGPSREVQPPLPLDEFRQAQGSPPSARIYNRRRWDISGLTGQRRGG